MTRSCEQEPRVRPVVQPCLSGFFRRYQPSASDSSAFLGKPTDETHGWIDRNARRFCQGAGCPSAASARERYTLPRSSTRIRAPRDETPQRNKRRKPRFGLGHSMTSRVNLSGLATDATRKKAWHVREGKQRGWDGRVTGCHPVLVLAQQQQQQQRAPIPGIFFVCGTLLRSAPSKSPCEGSAPTTKRLFVSKQERLLVERRIRCVSAACRARTKHAVDWRAVDARQIYG